MIPHIYHRAPSTARVDDGSAPITTSLGRRPKRAAPHGKEGAFDSEVEFAALELVRDDGGEAQSLPQCFQDIERAIGPGINQAPLGRVLHNRFGITFFEDTASELSQAFRRFGILSAAAIVENADLRALFMRIPHALDQLKMRDEGAISTFLTGFTHIHVRKDKEVKSLMSSKICTSMYLGFWRDVSMPIRIIPTNSIRTILAYWLKCTCWCQSRVVRLGGIRSEMTRGRPPSVRPIPRDANRIPTAPGA